MTRIRKLLQALGERSILQVMGTYIVVAWIVLQFTEVLTSLLELPTAFGRAVVVLLAIGFLVLLLTSIIQFGLFTGDGSRRFGGGLRRLFTLRNAVLGGVGAFALWGMIAAGWLMVERNRASRPARAEVGTAVTPPGAEVAGDPTPAGGLADSEAGQPAPPADASAEGETPGADPGPEAEEPVSVSASPAPPAAADEGNRIGARSFGDARGRAERSRAAAEAAGARDLRGTGMEAADSLWTEALRHATAGRFPEAVRDVDRARLAYERAGREASTVWVVRLDSARVSVDSIRRRAQSGTPDYRMGDSLLAEALRQERSGRPEDALTTVVRAGRSFQRALPAVELPPPEEPVAPPTPSTASAASPMELVSAALEEMRRAIESEDTGGLRRIWTSLSPAEVTNFEQFFRDREDIRVTYEVRSGSVRATQEGIAFVVDTSWDYLDTRSGRRERPPAFEQSFILVEQGGRRVLTGH